MSFEWSRREPPMIRKYIIPVLAITGIVFAILMLKVSGRPVPAAPPVAEPAQTPFHSSIAGAGIIEARSENIAIGTQVPGIVTEIYVKIGSIVKAGDPLFKIDDRSLQAELAVRKTLLNLAQARLARLQAMPRPEDVPPLEAQVKRAQASLADLKTQFSLMESVQDKRAISKDELNRRRYAAQVGEAQLSEAQAQLALMKAGTWKPDIDVARADAASAEAQVKGIETEIERLTVRAPVNGEVLQVKIHLGEFAQAGVLQTPLVLLGDISRFHVRVDVDEHDVWRFRSTAPAVAFVRGNSNMKTPLTFVRVEPYIVPKKSLTGDSTERVDTRVLQILYSFDRKALPVYIGQQMDVFIDAPPIDQAATAAAPQNDRQQQGKQS
jgi:HlyD family secretion protein